MTSASNAAPTERSADVVVIGGGINGAGIARDAAMRGLDVVLLEAGDFGSGTSSWSTRLIHGGLRYLEYAEIGLVRESLHERTRLRRNAPHLVKPLRITIPIYRSAKRGPLMVRLGMIAYDLLSFGKTMPGHDMLSADELRREVPGLVGEGLRAGARYFDAQVTFAERLVLENIIAAHEAGAKVLNYCPVSGIEAADGGALRVRYRNGTEDPSAEETINARSVVNAAGPWVDSVLELCPAPMQRLMGGTKGSHIVVGQFPGAPEDAIYVEAAADGRPVFIVPWNGQYLVGTTDIRVTGNPSESRASDDEIDYLLAEVNRVFPEASLGKTDIHFAYAGVRPLPYKEKGPESAITRKHIIKQHGGQWSALFSIIGGKLTTYRNLAEQVVDRLERHLDLALKACDTRESPLPGAVDRDDASSLIARFANLSAGGRDRLETIYGGRVRRLASLAATEPALNRCLDASGTVLAAEVVFAIREEFARTLTDIVHRRLMTGLAERIDTELVASIADLAARELNWSAQDRASQRAELDAHNLRLRR